MSSFPPFAVAVSVLWVKLGINKELILDVRDTIAGPHNEHGCEAALTCISLYPYICNPYISSIPRR